MIAKTLSGILDNPVVDGALNRETDIDKVVALAEKAWEPQMLERRPRILGFDRRGNHTSDLDGYTVFTKLADRGAVINIPMYEGMGGRASDTEWVISPKNRHGNLTALVASEKTHAFSLAFVDHNVVKGDVIGAPRNFRIVDDFGNWYRGIDIVEYKPDDDEGNFLMEKDLTGYLLPSHHFIHPNRAKGFYGARYISTKAALERVKDELSFVRSLSNKIRKEPSSRKGPVQRDRPREEGLVLEAKLELPDFRGRYMLPEEFSGGNLHYENSRIEEKERKLKGYRAKLLSQTKSIELAFLKYGLDDKSPGSEIHPGWGVPRWKRDYRTEENPRTRWNALPLRKGVNLLYRLKRYSA